MTHSDMTGSARNQSTEKITIITPSTMHVIDIMVEYLGNFFSMVESPKKARMGLPELPDQLTS